MSDPLAPVGQDAVRAAIQRAARATGVDFSMLVETARRESALNPHARAATSSATGLFQFIESTWLDMVRRHGPAHGLATQAAALRRGADAETRREILALRNDPELSARMAGELARENAAALQARLGRTPTAGELYAAHVMGQGGAVRLIEAAARGAPDAAALFPREAAANRGLFYAGGTSRSAQQLLNRLQLDAVAGVRDETQTPAPFAAAHGALSPALAQALFAFALLPLLNSNAEQELSGPQQGFGVYARNSR